MRRDNEPLSLGSPKQRALLGFLLLHANELVPRDRLIDELWGGDAPATANAALNGYLTKLRRLLADGASDQPLSTRPPGYVLHVVPDDVDARRFEALAEEGRAALSGGDPETAAATLRRALAVWRGPALADLAYEEFAQTEIRRLDELRLTTLEERIDADLELGRHDTLVAELDALVAENPYRERLRAQLMLALYRSGRQAEALDEYQAARRALVDDLGIEPGRHLQELERAILAHDASLELPARPSSAPPEGRATRRRTGALFLAPLVVALAAAVAVLLTRRSDTPAPLTLVGNSVVVVDPETVAPVAEIPIQGELGGIAVGEGSVWVGNRDRNTLLRIDPESREIRSSVRLGTTPRDIAVGSGSVWVLNDEVTWVLRVDPAQNAVVARMPIRGRAHPAILFTPHLLVGGGGVWVAHGGQVSRFEPATGKQTTVRRASIVDFAFGEDSLWLVGGTAADVIQRVLPSTNRLLSELEVSRVGATTSGLGMLAVGNGAVWATGRGDTTLFKLDPDLGNVVGGIPVSAGPRGVAFGEGAMWVVGTDNSLMRVDLASDRVLRTLRLSVPLSGFDGAATGTVVAGEGAVWIATA